MCVVANADAETPVAKLYIPTHTQSVYTSVQLDPELDMGPWRGEAKRVFSLPAHYIAPSEFKYALPRDKVVEFAFVGRSNVGKSSLISKLLGNSKLVRTSKAPGCTRSVNYFALAKGGGGGTSSASSSSSSSSASSSSSESAKTAAANSRKRPELYLVDLPGYGFAKAAKSEQEKWQTFIHAYLSGRTPDVLRRVFVLVDSRHGMKLSDIHMMLLLNKLALPYQIVLTKTGSCVCVCVQVCVCVYLYAFLLSAYSLSKAIKAHTLTLTTKRFVPSTHTQQQQQQQNKDASSKKELDFALTSVFEQVMKKGRMQSCLPYVHAVSSKSGDGIGALQESLVEICSHNWHNSNTASDDDDGDYHDGKFEAEAATEEEREKGGIQGEEDEDEDGDEDDDDDEVFPLEGGDLSEEDEAQLLLHIKEQAAAAAASFAEGQGEYNKQAAGGAGEAAADKLSVSPAFLQSLMKSKAFKSLSRGLQPVDASKSKATSSSPTLKAGGRKKSSVAKGRR